MKKVLLVATVQSHISQFHLPLVEMLHEKGYEVHAVGKDNLSEKSGRNLDTLDIVHNINFSRRPFNIRNIKAYKQLKKLINEEAYDIVHCNTPVGGILTRIACVKRRKRGETKVIYTAHGFHFYRGASKMNWMLYYPVEKFFSYFTDILVTITEEDYKLAVNKFNCRVYHIHGVGANSSKFYIMNAKDKQDARNELNLPENTRVILNIGELVPNKNQKFLINAMEQLIKKIPNSLLLIAGNGSEKENLQQLINDKKLDKHVRLLGYTNELCKYINISDVVAACSFREGLPVNLMEAMLCGKPIVATDNRGHRELVQEGINGFIVAPTDEAKLVEKLCEVITSEIDYVTFGLELVQPYMDLNVKKELQQLYNLC